jgi:uncharacterized protein YodC (DUF2158 family)
MESTNFQAGDSVQLLHGYTPTMTISQVNQENQTALCVWYDSSKTKRVVQDWIPLNVLKRTPEKQSLSLEELFPKQRIMP